MTDEFWFSGTLGDAFIALCKLSSYAAHHTCELRRFDRQQADAVVAELCTLFPNVRYVAPYKHIDTIEEMVAFAYANAGRFLNIYADGSGRGVEPDDPPGFPLVPFPSIALDGPPIERRAPVRIGVQLQSGTHDKTSKRLSLEWVGQLTTLLANKGVSTVVLGTSNGYDERALEDTLAGDLVENLVGKTDVRGWLHQLRSVDYLVSPDGCAVFFALSQRVPCLGFYDDSMSLALLRMPREWRDNATCMRFERPADPGAGLAPLPPAQAASIALARVAPHLA